MKRLVNGIGGLFFRAANSQGLALWYEKHFGINTVQNNGWRQDEGPTVFAPFNQNTGYFGNPNQQFMINLRVSDLEALLKQLEEDGVDVDPERLQEPYGKFAWVYDPEGNKIELWEPINNDKTLNK